MGQVDFIVIDTLGNYIGKEGIIEIWEFDLLQFESSRLPLKLIRVSGEVEDILCSYQLTDLIFKVPTVINYLPYFEVIETNLGRKSISINRVAEGELNLNDYKLIIHTLDETSEIIRKQIRENKK
jgi:hypothetical protein